MGREDGTLRRGELATRPCLFMAHSLLQHAGGGERQRGPAKEEGASRAMRPQLCRSCFSFLMCKTRPFALPLLPRQTVGFWVIVPGEYSVAAFWLRKGRTDRFIDAVKWKRQSSLYNDSTPQIIVFVVFPSTYVVCKCVKYHASKHALTETFK